MSDRRIGTDAFEVAAEEIKRLNKVPDNQELLDTYMYYKQVIVGDCNTARPGMLDMKGKAKWDAWNGIKGMAKEEADRLYIEYVNKLKEKYGLQQ
ncbi:acyl-CoA-binding protein-like [Patiria miniata]|uniref:ACB domain-containing protein n=1 Tax=Patiria miniata TaxID=46514 RepID=A0A914BLI6_PATMI|nr:acyl-CoA-binding protein-like [Patiria miniata]